MEMESKKVSVKRKGHRVSVPKTLNANVVGNSSDDEEVEDEDECENVEVQDLDNDGDEESNEVDTEAYNDDVGAAEDDEDEGDTEHASSAPRELDVQMMMINSTMRIANLGMKKMMELRTMLRARDRGFQGDNEQ